MHVCAAKITSPTAWQAELRATQPDIPQPMVCCLAGHPAHRLSSRNYLYNVPLDTLSTVFPFTWLTCTYSSWQVHLSGVTSMLYCLSSRFASGTCAADRWRSDGGRAGRIVADTLAADAAVVVVTSVPQEAKEDDAEGVADRAHERACQGGPDAVAAEQRP